MEKPIYSLLVPVYNEEEVLPIFYAAVMPIMEKLEESFEIVFVNDGSKDQSENILREMSTKDERVKVINFSRNFGQQAAIHAALGYAKGSAMIIMDVDLQDPPEVAVEMIAKWKEGYDVVHGKRAKRRGETLFKKISAFFYYRFLRKITDMDIPSDTGEFKLYDRKVVDTILALPEHNRYLRGLSTWVGYKQTLVEFERPERTVGVTKWTIKKMIKLAGDGIVANSSYPLFLSIKIGLLGIFLSLAAFVTFMVLILCGISLPLVVWLFPTITLVGAIVLTLSGFNNIYVGRIYDEVKQRPLYIVREAINTEK